MVFCSLSPHHMVGLTKEDSSGIILMGYFWKKVNFSDLVCIPQLGSSGSWQCRSPSKVYSISEVGFELKGE